MVDDTIGSTWGYTTGMKVASAAPILGRLIDTVSKGGTYLLNISPMADGTIPQAQQKTLLDIGAWLEINGEAIYGTHPWTQFDEGGAPNTPNWRFTVKGGALYAIGNAPPDSEVIITSLGKRVGKVKTVEMLGERKPLRFTQEESGLKVKLPSRQPGQNPFALKITGLNLK
jgi:alpha-L-fucosidase